jgi:hypothetical protein
MTQNVTLEQLRHCMATPDIFHLLLEHQTQQAVRLKSLRSYIFKFGLPQLRRVLPSEHVYSNYDILIDEICRRVKRYVIAFPDDVYLINVVTNDGLRAINNLRYWRSLTDEDKERLCSRILIPPGQMEFIDINMFGTSKNDYESGFALNTFCDPTPYQSINQGLFNKISIQDVAQVCIQHIGQQALNVFPEFDDYKEELRLLVQQQISSHVARNEKRLKKIIEKLTLAVLLKRIRKGLATKTDLTNMEKAEPRIRLNNTQFPEVVLEVLLVTALNLKTIASIRNAPTSEQPTLLKLCFIKSKVLGSGSFAFYFKQFFSAYYVPPFMLDFPQFGEQLEAKIISQLELTANDVAYISAISRGRIARLPALTVADRKMLEQFSQRRLLHMLQLHDFSITNIVGDTFIAKLYLAGIDAGVTRARLRALFKSFYLGYLPEIASNFRPSYLAHDILLQYEPVLFTLFDKWSKYPRHVSLINRVVNMLISQMGGAQGIQTNAFNHWYMLTTLPGHEDVLLQHHPANLKECIYLAQNNPSLVAVIDEQLRSSRFHGKRPELFMTYASGLVPLNDIHDYLSQILREKSVRYARHHAITSSLTHECSPLTIDILPWDDLVGNLGVAVQGVCIGFHGQAHHEQRTPAVANFVVRSDSKLLLWGLLIRLQNDTSTPAYLLNNLQGALPSSFAKMKRRVKDAIVTALGQLGDVYLKDNYFNAIPLVDDDTPKVSCDEHVIVVPSMRLDVDAEPFSFDNESMQFGEFIKVVGRLYMVPCSDPISSLQLHRHTDI